MSITAPSTLRASLNDHRVGHNPNALKQLRATAEESLIDTTGKTGFEKIAAELAEVIATCDQRLVGMGVKRNESRGEIPVIHRDILPGDANGKLPNPSGIFKNATSEELEVLRDMAGFIRSGAMATATLTPTGDAGVLMPVFVQTALERNYAQFSPVVDNCRLFATETGNVTRFPVLSDSETGEQVASAANTGADPTVSGDTPPTDLTGPEFTAYKTSSKPVFVPRETFTDSDVDLVSEVVGALFARLVRFENNRFTNGTGSAQAEGFLRNCQRFETSGTLDLDMALDLAYSVGPLYRPRGIYMASDTTIKYLRKLRTGIAGDKRYLWAFEDANATLGTPATLHGYPIIVNNDMRDVQTDGSFEGGELAFGDFKRFVVRQAENNGPFLYNYAVPARDGRAVIAFRRTDSHLLVPEAISKLAVAGS